MATMATIETTAAARPAYVAGRSAVVRVFDVATVIGMSVKQRLGLAAFQSDQLQALECFSHADKNS